MEKWDMTSNRLSFRSDRTSFSWSFFFNCSSVWTRSSSSRSLSSNSRACLSALSSRFSPPTISLRSSCRSFCSRSSCSFLDRGMRDGTERRPERLTLLEVRLVSLLRLGLFCLVPFSISPYHLAVFFVRFRFPVRFLLYVLDERAMDACAPHVYHSRRSHSHPNLIHPHHHRHHHLLEHRNWLERTLWIDRGSITFFHLLTQSLNFIFQVTNHRILRIFVDTGVILDVLRTIRISVGNDTTVRESYIPRSVTWEYWVFHHNYNQRDQYSQSKQR